MHLVKKKLTTFFFKGVVLVLEFTVTVCSGKEAVVCCTCRRVIYL